MKSINTFRLYLGCKILQQSQQRCNSLFKLPQFKDSLRYPTGPPDTFYLIWVLQSSSRKERTSDDGRREQELLWSVLLLTLLNHSPFPSHCLLQAIERFVLLRINQLHTFITNCYTAKHTKCSHHWCFHSRHYCPGEILPWENASIGQCLGNKPVLLKMCYFTRVK